MAEAVSQERHKHDVYAIVTVVNAGVPSTKDGLSLAKYTPEDPFLESRVPCHRNAGAEAAIEGLEGILGMASHGPDGLKAEDRIVDLSLQREVDSVLQVLLAGKDRAARVHHEVLHTVDFVRRQLRAPL